MNSQLTLRGLRTVAIMAAFAAGLLVGCNASSRADQRADALDKAIPAAMQRASVPGAIVGIWQDGREPYVRAFGVRDTATRQPMATDLSMRIGSTSKTFTVTAILMLAKEGKLGLDDPIDRYVEGVPSGKEITLRQLAAMRSGLLSFRTHDHTHAFRPFVGWGKDHVFGRKLILESCRRSSDVNFHLWLWAASSTNVRCRAFRAARTTSVSSKSLILRWIGTWKLMGARSI